VNPIDETSIELLNKLIILNEVNSLLIFNFKIDFYFEKVAINEFLFDKPEGIKLLNIQ
jgi:hypothetical protein